jgi:energy-converting hydrogenase Eha subunit A
MPFGRRRSGDREPADPDRRGLGPFLKRWTIPIIGALTPTALIVVNISIFIAKNLSEFRVTITILAFVSGIMLNSWTALNIYRVLQQRRPDHAIVHERNQEVVLVIGMAVVILAAALTALFCYLGLANYNNLPNGLTFFTGFFAAAIPIFLRAVFSRGTRRGSGRVDSQITAVAGLPPGPPLSPPTSSSIHRTVPRR